LPINEGAAALLGDACRRLGLQFFDKHGVPREWLVGNIAVLFGYREFMESL